VTDVAGVLTKPVGAYLMEDASIAFSANTLLDSNFDREDVAGFMQSNDFSWSSAEQIALLGLLVAAQEGVVLHAERRRH